MKDQRLLSLSTEMLYFFFHIKYIYLILSLPSSLSFLFVKHIAESYCLSLTRSGNRSSKTFKPKKNIPEGSHQYELLKHAEATLGSGNLRMAVMLPDGEDLNEWVAVNSKGQVHFSSSHKPLS